MTETPRRQLDFLEKAGLVLLALQLAVLAKLWNELGFDGATDGYLIFVFATTLFVAGQRKLTAKPPNRGTAPWIFASRAALLSVLALGTLVVAFDRLSPEGVPAFAPTALVVLMWASIALKGAGIGKLQPGGAMGLRVPWTMRSRLAWDRAHRVLGRILFLGGLAGLATSFVLPLLTSIALWFGVVGLAVTAALIESWRTWRLDPDRARPA